MGSMKKPRKLSGFSRGANPNLTEACPCVTYSQLCIKKQQPFKFILMLIAEANSVKFKQR